MNEYDMFIIHGEFRSIIFMSRLIRHRDTVTPLSVSHLRSSDCFR